MIPHELKIGDTIYDTYNNRWGEVSVLPDGVEAIWLEENDDDVTIGYESEDSYCETYASEAYPLAVGRYFWGEDVCHEINGDHFDDEHDFDFFCPNRNENCWAFECTDCD